MVALYQGKRTIPAVTDKRIPAAILTHEPGIEIIALSPGSKSMPHGIDIIGPLFKAGNALTMTGQISGKTKHNRCFAGTFMRS